MGLLREVAGDAAAVNEAQGAVQHLYCRPRIYLLSCLAVATAFGLDPQPATVVCKSSNGPFSLARYCFMRHGGNMEEDLQLEWSILQKALAT